VKLLDWASTQFLVCHNHCEKHPCFSKIYQCAAAAAVLMVVTVSDSYNVLILITDGDSVIKYYTTDKAFLVLCAATW